MIIGKPFPKTPLLLLMAACALSAAAQTASCQSHADYHWAMSNVRERLPSGPLLITGRLMGAGRIGEPEPICLVEIALLLSRPTPESRYTILDLFGNRVEQLTIKRLPDLQSSLLYEAGSPLARTRPPDLQQSIRGSDITWNDLSMSFLWRSDGALVGVEPIKGRECFVIEFAKPGQPVESRLWIDTALFMLIQAEEYDDVGNRTRRLSVKNIKKIEGRWMIKDLELRKFPSMHRTLLRITGVRNLDDPTAN